MEHVPTVQNDPLKGSDLSLAKEEKDKGSAFIARERFPYFLLVALVRPAIDKASPPLAPFLATLTLSHPLCTLFHAALYLEMHFPSSPSTPFDSPESIGTYCNLQEWSTSHSQEFLRFFRNEKGATKGEKCAKLMWNIYWRKKGKKRNASNNATARRAPLCKYGGRATWASTNKKTWIITSRSDR